MVVGYRGIVSYLDDGVDDGLYYITSSDIVERVKTGNGGSLNYETLRTFSYLIPKLINRILDTHKSDKFHKSEGGSVGNYEHWEDGGRSANIHDGNPTATEQVKKAREKFEQLHPNEVIDYFVHDHPSSYSGDPSDPGDRQNIGLLRNGKYNFGILIHDNNVIFFRDLPNNDVKVTKDQIKEFISR
jgi:hypothetical protein